MQQIFEWYIIYFISDIYFILFSKAIFRNCVRDLVLFWEFEIYNASVIYLKKNEQQNDFYLKISNIKFDT